MTKEKFIDIWNELDDEMRLRWLAKVKDNLNIPEHEIFIDRDCVFLFFKDEMDLENDDDRTMLYFDEYGYNFIHSTFKALGIKNAGI